MANIVDDVGVQASLHPERLAVREMATGRCWSYAAWDKAVAQAASVLRLDLGLVVGERVAVLARNCAEQILLHLAAARTGIIFVPLNWRLTPLELRQQIDDCDPAILIGDSEFCIPVQDGRNMLEISTFRHRVDGAIPLPSIAFDRHCPSLILYTSGTSGRPKGVLLSEHNISQTATNFGMLGCVTHESVTLADTPMFHIIGILTNFRPGFMRGGAVLIGEGFEAERTLARLADPELRVTHYFCVPQMARMLRTAPGFDSKKLRGLTAIFSGGAPHPAADIRAWLNDGIPIADGFGMSEAGTVSCMPLHIPLIDAKAGACGIVPPSIALRFVDEQDRDVPSHTPGELLLKGENIFSGYWRAPEETARAFTEDGWFRTGDIARQDEEGFLFLVDRKKDMFISGGENVYPVEIEAALADLTGITEAAVVGVPDVRWGEVGHLAVVVSSETAALDAAAILAYLDKKLARYKIPKYVSFLTAIPRTGTGKIQKVLLKSQLAGLHDEKSPQDSP